MAGIRYSRAVDGRGEIVRELYRLALVGGGENATEVGHVTGERDPRRETGCKQGLAFYKLN